MNKKVILIIVIVLVLVIGAGAAVLSLNKDESKNNSSATNQTSQTEQTDQLNQNNAEEQAGATKVEGNLFTITEGKKAIVCDMNYSESGGEGTGKMYTDGAGRGRIQLNLTTERGNTGETNEKVYTWTKTNSGTMGFVMSADTLKNDTSGGGSSTDSSTQTAGKSFKMSCNPWNVDESFLSVPSNVKFTDPTSLSR